jgi:hypothetical protein
MLVVGLLYEWHILTDNNVTRQDSTLQEKQGTVHSVVIIVHVDLQ